MLNCEPAPVLPTTNSCASMSAQVLIGEVCQAVHMPSARSRLPSQLNFSASKRAPAVPNSGASGTVEWMIPMVVPSCGACA